MVREHHAEQRPGGSEGRGHEDKWRRAFQAEGMASAKALRWDFLACLRSSEELVWMQQAGRESVGDKVRDGSKASILNLLLR